MTSFVLPFRPVTAQPVVAWLRAHRHEAAGGVLVAAAVLGGFVAIAGPAGSLPRTPTPEEQLLETTPRPVVEPLIVQAIAPEKAVEINAALPVDTGPNPPARPFKAPPVKSVAYARALECLTQAIYYEAAREPTDGQRAVAQVVLNRVRHPAYPSSVCGVVYQGSERDTGCQFTFTCDGSLTRAPMRSYWDRARQIAHEALQGYVYAPVGNATHYHTNYVVPYWASSLRKSAVIATHIFYRWAGGWGMPAAFGQRYSGKEADPYALKLASLAAEARDRATPDTPAEVVVQAKQELPADLAKLIDSEVNAKGDTRVIMRIPQGNPNSKEHLAELDKVMSSRNLQWGLTGEDPKAPPQKAFGKPKPATPPSPASTPATADAAPKSVPAGEP